MSDWYIGNVDRATLPTDMLPMFKTHCRVTFNDDDDYLKLCLVRAIDLFERHAGWYVFETTVEWTPVDLPTAGVKKLPLPVQPVTVFVVLDSVGTDVTADYRIRPGSAATLPSFIERKDGAVIPAGLVITLDAGYISYTTMPPSVVDIAFRVGAHFYENRESVTSYSLSEVPQWMNDLLLGNWIPRA